MKTHVIPPSVVITVIVVAVLVIGWLAYLRFRPGPEKAYVGLGPPAEIIKRQPPILGPGGRPVGQSGTAIRTGPPGSAGAAGGGVGPPPPPAQGFQGGTPPPPTSPPGGYR